MSANQIWHQYFDPTYKQPYYFNIATEETVWEEPKDGQIVDKTESEPAAPVESGE